MCKTTKTAPFCSRLFEWALSYDVGFSAAVAVFFFGRPAFIRGSSMVIEIPSVSVVSLLDSVCAAVVDIWDILDILDVSLTALAMLIVMPPLTLAALIPIRWLGLDGVGEVLRLLPGRLGAPWCASWLDCIGRENERKLLQDSGVLGWVGGEDTGVVGSAIPGVGVRCCAVVGLALCWAVYSAKSEGFPMI